MSTRVNSHQGPEIVVAGGGVEVAARRPGRVQRVDVVDEMFGQYMVVPLGTYYQPIKEKVEEHFADKQCFCISFVSFVLPYQLP